MFNSVDWRSVFLPDAPFLEIIVRGSVMYLALFIMLRIVLKRQVGTLGMTDLLLITLLADASQNAMAGEYKSLPDGVVLVATIIFWNYLFDWLSVESEWFERLIEPPPLPLVKRGKLLRRNRYLAISSPDNCLKASLVLMSSALRGVFCQQRSGRDELNENMVFNSFLG